MKMTNSVEKNGYPQLIEDCSASTIKEVLERVLHSTTIKFDSASELNPAPSLIIGCCVAMWVRYWAATQAKGPRPEIFTVSVSDADIVHLTEDSILITVNPNLRSWNIAVISGIWLGDMGRGGGPETAARYQTDTMGTREGQDVLHWKACGIKSINSKMLHMTLWEPVPSKQGNFYRGEGLAEVRCGDGGTFSTHGGRQRMPTKPASITVRCRGYVSEYLDEKRHHVRFYEGVHSSLEVITPEGGAL
jgi:hypothetical protein